MDLNKIENRGKWSEQTTRLNSNFNKISQETESLKSTYKALTQSEVLVVSTLPQEGESNTIYRVVGISSYSDYMYNPDDLNTPILMATYNNAIDDVPTAGSNNLVKSGGVKSAIDALINSGSSTQRPTTIIDVGFMYFDTTLGKPIWAKEVDTTTTPITITWVDALGNPVE